MAHYLFRNPSDPNPLPPPSTRNSWTKTSKSFAPGSHATIHSFQGHKTEGVFPSKKTWFPQNGCPLAVHSPICYMVRSLKIIVHICMASYGGCYTIVPKPQGYARSENSSSEQMEDLAKSLHRTGTPNIFKSQQTARRSPRFEKLGCLKKASSTNTNRRAIYVYHPYNLIFHQATNFLDRVRFVQNAVITDLWHRPGNL
jgi:hypothetical protein